MLPLLIGAGVFTLSVRMVWHDMLFLHWPLDPAVLAPLLPAGLELDTLDGSAWLGVVPFRMSGVTPALVPPLPWLSITPELNVRTYVRAGGRGGVWFFSLDAANPAVVEVARATFHLPYLHAVMSCRRRGDRVRYRSRRTDARAPAASFRATYRPTGPAARSVPGGLDAWLTERYSLFARDGRGRLLRGDIEHRPWRLRSVEVHLEEQRMTGEIVPAGLGAPVHVCYGERLEVLAAPLVALGGAPDVPR